MVASNGEKNEDVRIDIDKDFGLIAASFRHQYQIELNNEWLSNNSAIEFWTLLSGLTKYSALGQVILSKNLKKYNNSNEKTMHFNNDKKGWNNLAGWAESFKKKGV